MILFNVFFVIVCFLALVTDMGSDRMTRTCMAFAGSLNAWVVGHYFGRLEIIEKLQQLL